MYKNKPFRVKSDEEIDSHLEKLKDYYKTPPKRVFLADGNFMCLKIERILSIINKVKLSFPEIERISSYCSANDLINKSSKDLAIIREAGLSMLYIGVESGSDNVLSYVNKGANSSQMIEGCGKAKNTGYILSCMIISGLGGKKYFQEHAIESARVISAINPDYFGLLSLTLDKESDLMKDIEDKRFILLSPKEIVEENIIMLKNLELTNCIFRANHISNHVILKGTLNKDKEILLNKLIKIKNDKNFISNSLKGL
ncbi:radical SAM protein [Sedimentibacter sp. zth1]|uniref:radical SAM protein n=1 Tax=Sedimentibacter sp. zth1 TaxID=2816908 RepID=UPI001A92569D|nr:radical SAM protein [Sedimentibacter sp. zth1]